MTCLYKQLSLIVRLRAFYAALALVSLSVFCAPNAKADVIYSYVAADAPTCSIGHPDCAYNAGTTFTIDSPGFLPFTSPFTYVPVTTSDDLYSYPTDYGQLLDVIFVDPWTMGGVAASNFSTPTFLWTGFTNAQGYNPEVAGVYTDAVGDTLTVTVTTPEPDAAVLSLTGMALGMMEVMRRRLAGSTRKAAV
jgi:hypothetical protein